MTALPADIARFTQDGRLIVKSDPAIKAAHAGARDVGTGELEMFCDNVADADVLMTERFSILGLVGRVHEGIQVEESLGLGTTVPIAPAAPNLYLQDDSRGMMARAAIRAYSFDHTNDSFALEMTGTTG